MSAPFLLAFKRLSKTESTHFYDAGRLCFVLVVLVILSGRATSARPALADEDVEVALAAGGTARVLVALWPAEGLAQAQENVLADAPTFHVTRRYRALPALAGVVDEVGLEALRRQPKVRAVNLDLPVKVALAESTLFIHADDVWQGFGLTGAGVNVAVLDTGIDRAHPDLADSIVAQHCFTQGNCLPGRTNESDNAQDEQGHGTHVAGIITGPGGVAPDAGIVAVRVLNSSGTGATSDVIAGLEWVLAHHTEWQIKAVNLSLGGGSFAGVCDTANANTLLYAQAAQALRDAGLTLFAASGNSGKAEEMMAPACVSRVVAVGNLYDTPLPRLDWPTCADEAVIPGRVPCSSNSSSALDLLAPGVSINATWLGGGQAVRSGTSMSTPHAVAVAALLWQAAPELRPDELEAALIETGPLVTDTRQGRVTPRLDALAAVEHVRSTISGTARLQGRTDHSGVSIFLAGEDCQPPQAVTVTDTAGHFEVSFNAAQSAPYLCATHPGYLTARRNAAGGEAADVILPGGDVTGDNIINIFDIARIASRYGGSDPVADVNGDGHVDIFDLTIAAGNYNKSGPFSWP